MDRYTEQSAITNKNGLILGIRYSGVRLYSSTAGKRLRQVTFPTPAKVAAVKVLWGKFWGLLVSFGISIRKVSQNDPAFLHPPGILAPVINRLHPPSSAISKVPKTENVAIIQ